MSADTRHDDLRMQLAEVGGALSDDDLEGAENRALQLLSDIRRRQQGGDADDE